MSEQGLSLAIASDGCGVSKAVLSNWFGSMPSLLQKGGRAVSGDTGLGQQGSNCVQCWESDVAGLPGTMVPWKVWLAVEMRLKLNGAWLGAGDLLRRAGKLPNSQCVSHPNQLCQ